MKLFLETNIMVGIFKGELKFSILQETIKSIKDREKRETIFGTLKKINDVFKMITELLPEGVVLDEEFIDFSLELYLDRLTLVAFEFNIKECYKKCYINRLRNDILDYWNQLKKDKSAEINGRDFIKMFDEIHEYALKNNGTLFIKQLSSLKNLYRGVRGNFYNNYNRMIPDDKYAKNNRWNPDGKAFLYLGLGEEHSCESINRGIRTCFEELRLKEEEYATICSFEGVNNNCKLLDLSIDEDVNNYEEIQMNNYIQGDIDKLLNDEVFVGRCKEPATRGERRKLKRMIKKACTNNKDNKVVTRYIATNLLWNINEAIFLPIDEEKDPNLEAYIPFRLFAEYLIEKGYGGIIHKSTRMDLIDDKGKDVVLFNKDDAKVCNGSMKLFQRKKEGDIRLK